MGPERTEREQTTGDQQQFARNAREVVEAGPRPDVGNAITQAKLAVGPVDDRYEREADGVADRALRTIRSAQTTGGTAPRQRAGGAKVARSPISRIMREADRSSAAGAAGGALEPEVAARIQRASGGGKALDEGTRSQMESAIGADFSGVKIHENSSLAPEIGAQAFTHGSDVHFAPGQFDPTTSGGQHLIAHELTHVVQQTGTAQRVQAKMWDAKTFKKNTAVNSKMGIFSDSSTAQDVILSLLSDYEKFLGKGFSSSNPAHAAKAVSQIRAMQDVAKRWISHRGEIYEDSSNFTLASTDQAKKTHAAKKNDTEKPGPEAIASNPKAERMRGLQSFITLCDSEIALLSQSLSDDALADAAIDTTNKKYAKAVKRYPDEKDATSVFAKVGELAEMLVGANGSKAKLTIDAAIPVQPGVDVTIGLVGSAERSTEGRVSLRGEIHVGVKGTIAGAAELKASLGGYLEANGKSGAEAATLMSYALYRRGREGSAPTDVISMLWGGTTGTAGLARSEAWSRQLEEQVWGDEAEGSGDAYVESGGIVSASASVGDESTLGGELSGGAYAGRRVDKQSLMERKGGAGEQNVKSDSVLNAGKRQKRVGSSVGGWSVSGKVSGGGFSAEIGVSRKARTIGGGASGIKKQTIWEDTEVTVNGSGPMPPALDLGAKIYQLAEKVVRKADEAAKKQKDPDAAADKALLKGLATMAPQYFNPKMELPAAADLTVSITMSGANWSVAIGTEKASKLPIPEVLKVKLTKSQTFLQISSKGGAISTWYLGQ